MIYQENEYPRIKGAQVFVLDARYKDDLDAFFKDARSRGTDTVFLRAFHNAGDRTHLGLKSEPGHGVYFHTKAAPVIFDILGPAVEAAHRNGVRIYAWMATRSLTGLKTPENLSVAYSPSGDTEAGYGADIFKKQVRETLIELFKDLARYDIDGILFQDDFIIKYAEGASMQARELFSAETGIEPSAYTFFKSTAYSGTKKIFTEPTEEFYIWSRWKAAHLAKLFSELKNSALSVNPDIKFAANIYYETPVYPEKGLAWYSQDLNALVGAGADYLAVMGYAEQISKEMNLSDKETARYLERMTAETAKKAGYSSRALIKLQSRYFEGSRGRVSQRSFDVFCSAAKKTSGVSLAVVPVFTVEDILNSCFQ